MGAAKGPHRRLEQKTAKENGGIEDKTRLPGPGRESREIHKMGFSRRNIDLAGWRARE